MDWIEFLEKLGKPNIEINQLYFDKFINNPESVLISLFDDTKNMGDKKDINYNHILGVVETIQSRGAIQGRDYIIVLTTVETDRTYKIVNLYTTKNFISEEDWIA